MGRKSIICNPAAGQGSAREKIPAIEALLRRAGIEYELLETEGAGHAVELARTAARSGADAVVSAGGDGTLNEVLNGLMLEKRESGVQPPALGKLCIGRGNDFGFGMGIPLDLETGVEALRVGYTRRIDVGLITGGNHPEGRFFGNGIGIGFDTIVGLEAAKLKWARGFIAYLVGALKTMLFYFDTPMTRITLDGRVIEQNCILVSIMNGRRMGGGFYMTPEAVDNDGLLDLCIGGTPNRLEILGLIGKFIKGTQKGNKHIKFERAKVITVETTEGRLPAHADGETISIDAKTLRVECFPQELDILVPAPSEG